MTHLSGGAKGGIAFGSLVAMVIAITIYISVRRHRRDNIVGYRAGWGTAALDEEQQRVQQAKYQAWKEQKAQEKEEKRLEKKMRSQGPSRTTSVAPSLAEPERVKIAEGKGRLDMLEETEVENRKMSGV